jgi:hypothetical protein
VALSGRLSKPHLVGHTPLIGVGRSGSFDAQWARRAWRSTKWRRRVGAKTSGHGRRAVTAVGGWVRSVHACPAPALLPSSSRRSTGGAPSPAPARRPQGRSHGEAQREKEDELLSVLRWRKGQ